jgi:hypothetical protein
MILSFLFLYVLAGQALLFAIAQKVTKNAMLFGGLLLTSTSHLPASQQKRQTSYEVCP